MSLGCAKNQVDTERMLAALPRPARLVDEPSRAELLLVNTCGFIRPAVEESVAVIMEACAEAGEARRRPLVVVAGCLVSRYEADLRRDIPEVDVWCSTRELSDFGRRVAQALAEPARDFGPRLATTAPSFAYLKVSEGCAKRCAFCAIPSIRGKPRSVPVDELLEEARGLLATGRRELVLVAQDLTAYGRDLGDKDGLKRLISGLAGLSGLAWLRLLYLYPSGLTDGLLRFLKDLGPPLLPYFDIPLQHSHPDILAAMGRPFQRDPAEVVERVRSFFPDAALRTSLIVGYPGEKPHHFKHLLSFVEAARLTHVGVFPYWREEGTRAAELPGQVSAGVKMRRRDELMAVQAGIAEDHAASFVGADMDVLVDAASPEWPGLHLGRVWWQAPEADGVTFVSGAGVRPGALLRATVVESKTYDLVALAEPEDDA